MLRTPRLAGVRADYDRVLKQRNSLLKTAGAARRGSSREESALSTLGVWDDHLARAGAELLAARLGLVDELRPLRRQGLRDRRPRRVARRRRRSTYQPVVRAAGRRPTAAALAEALLAEVERRRDDELDRGVSLVGPHRDELLLTLGRRRPGCR